MSTSLELGETRGIRDGVLACCTYTSVSSGHCCLVLSSMARIQLQQMLGRAWLWGRFGVSDVNQVLLKEEMGFSSLFSMETDRAQPSVPSRPPGGK